MFDSVRQVDRVPKKRLGAVVSVSIAFHVLLIAGLIWTSARPAPKKRSETQVTFYAAPPRAPAPLAASFAPPPPPPPARRAAVEHKFKPRKSIAMIRPKEIPQEKPKEEDPEPESPAAKEDPAESGVAGGQVGGQAGGVVGGVLGGQVGGQLGGVLPFGEGMTRPQRLDGRDPSYSREAIEAHVQGVMVVKCLITVDGRVENCRIMKALPFMEKPVLEALSSAHYKPVTFQGRPIAVDYVFNIRLMMPP